MEIREEPWTKIVSQAGSSALHRAGGAGGGAGLEGAELALALALAPVSRLLCVCVCALLLSACVCVSADLWLIVAEVCPLAGGGQRLAVTVF